MMTDKSCYGQARDPYAATFGQANAASLGAPMPVAQSPLSNVIDNLRRKVGSLEQLFEATQQKLSPILVSIPEQPEKCSTGITGAQSAITMELSELEYRLGVLCRKIDLLITRIEV